VGRNESRAKKANGTPEQNAVHFGRSLDGESALHTARIPIDAEIQGGTFIGPNVTIGRDSRIGHDVVLAAGVTTGMGVKVLADSEIGPDTTIAPYTIVPEGTKVELGSFVIAEKKSDKIVTL
jgi:UDP-3-O-[3-hydroxymyristoyl] glucosamine N-acyltransferase